MAEAMGGVLVIVSMVVGTVSFVGLFRRLPSLWLPTRKRAATAWIASVVVFALGGALLPTEEARRDEENRRATETARTEEARRAELISAAREANALAAEESFPTRRDDFEQRLDELEELINNEEWVEAKSRGEALQQELVPLFRSSIAETPEVVSIRTRLNDALGVARKEENVLRRQATEQAAQTPSPQQLAIETIKNYPEVLDAAISRDGQDFRLALIVPANTPQARAQELGDNFVRMVKSYADTPPQREIGPGEYDYTIGVYTQDERQIAVGAKVAFARNITW